jgi:hypothetical protein
MVATFHRLGGIDVNAIRDCDRMTGVSGTVLNLLDHDQYRAFHGHEPPPSCNSPLTKSAAI